MHLIGYTGALVLPQLQRHLDPCWPLILVCVQWLGGPLVMAGSSQTTDGPLHSTAATLLTSPGPACPSGLDVGFRWPSGLWLAVIRQVGLAPLIIHAPFGKHKLPIQSSGAWIWVEFFGQASCRISMNVILIPGMVPPSSTPTCLFFMPRVHKHMLSSAEQALAFSI